MAETESVTDRPTHAQRQTHETPTKEARDDGLTGHREEDGNKAYFIEIVSISFKLHPSKLIALARKF